MDPTPLQCIHLGEFAVVAGQALEQGAVEQYTIGYTVNWCGIPMAVPTVFWATSAMCA